MKKILLALCCCWGLLDGLSAQDLITRTIAGEFRPRTRSSQPNPLAQRLAERPTGSTQVLRPLALTRQSSASAVAPEEVSFAVALELETTALAGFWRSPGTDLLVQIPVAPGRFLALELTQVNLTRPGFSVKTADGTTALAAPTGLFYQGIVAGDPQSVAALSIFPDHVRLMLSDAEGTYVVGQMPEAPRDYVLYNDRNLHNKPEFDCGAETLPGVGQQAHPDENALSPQADGDCVGIHFECDFPFYQSFGSNLLRMVDYTLAMFNEVATLYRNERINIELEQIFAWTTPDPYGTLSGTGAALQAFGQRIQNNYTGRLAHLLSGRPLGGGIAWVGVLCSNYFTQERDGVVEHAGPYGVSAMRSSDRVERFPRYSWPVYVVTHELGHNFGSEHTHACVWNGNNTQIDDCGNTASGGDGVIDSDNDGQADDGCYNPFRMPAQTRILPAGGGTIMSYCHQNAVGINFNAGFGPQPGNLIRDRVNAAACLKGNCSCEDFATRTVNGAPIASLVYHARQTITSAGDANAAANNLVIFQAGQRVVLQPGFEATDFFLAQIANLSCGPTGTAVAPSMVLPTPLSPGPLLAGPELTVFPNPASEELTIKLRLASASTASLTVYNSYGQVVQVLEKPSQQPRGEQQRRLLLGDWSAGLYFLVLQTPHERLVQPFVVTAH